MRAQLEKTVIDCPDPQQLASFYAQLLSMRVLESSVSLGAERAPGSPETGYRVFRDPAGHPFCLVFGASPVQDARFGFDTTREGS